MSEPSDTSITDLQSVLAEEGSELTTEQVRALRDFIHEVGSLEEAALALELLDELDQAA